nr:MAG TPA: hypothetical protein [Caudoviricetes sp.]
MRYTVLRLLIKSNRLTKLFSRLQKSFRTLCRQSLCEC